MGNCFSDPSAPKKGSGHTLGSGPSSGAHGAAAVPPSTGPSVPTRVTSPGRPVGDGFEDPNRGRTPQEMARIAAEQRAQASQQRGVQGKGGKLSAQLEANKKKPARGQEEDESRLMDRGNWN